MKKRISIYMLIIIIILSNISLINAKENERVTGWLNGNEYIELPAEMKYSYVNGLFDMFSFFISNDTPEIYSLIEDKMTGISNEQIQEIYDKYLHSHPDKLHYPAANIFFNAMYELFIKDAIENLE